MAIEALDEVYLDAQAGDITGSEASHNIATFKKTDGQPGYIPAFRIKEIEDDYICERGIVLNPKFIGVGTSGDGANWSDRNNGNVFSFADGVLTVVTINDTAVNFSQTITGLDISNSNGVIRASFDYYIPASLPVTPFFFLYVSGPSANNVLITSVTNPEFQTNEGWHTLILEKKLSDIIASDIDEIRIDFRLGSVGVKLKSPAIAVGSSANRDYEYIKKAKDEAIEDLISEVNVVLNPKFVDVNTAGDGANWEDAKNGNVFSFVDGVAEVVTINDNTVIFRQTITDLDIKNLNGVIRASFDYYIPASLPVTPTFYMYLSGPINNTVLVGEVFLKKTQGWHTLIYDRRISDYITGDVDEIRIDFRLGSVGVKIKSPAISVGAAAARVFVKRNLDIFCDGDSLTHRAQGNGLPYPDRLQAKLGNYLVFNRGVGGEGTLEISARIGAIPMKFYAAFALPADGSWVTIPTYDDAGTTRFGLLSTHDDSEVNPLLSSDKDINPCFIQNIECTLEWTETNYRVKRNVAGTRAVTIATDSHIYPQTAKNLDGIYILFFGQNGGYANDADFIDQIRKVRRYYGTNKFLFLSTHITIDSATRVALRKEFGIQHVDLKSYYSTDAIYDAIDRGYLAGDGTYPTAQDSTDMNNGECPTSLLSDGIHFTSVGYDLLTDIVKLRGEMLAFW
jgi:hypothetical protein